ncbi:MAG: asparagine synthase (glutamine-hydrolyzing) [Fibrobacteria bacterium]|nr:asparagine synthase (glutamine-hydrolyzing) [Fibrobacteria bacterium]
MCGIYGQYLFSPHSAQHEELLALTGKITDMAWRRGPDDRGVWSDKRKQCYFGFRRLSILDLSVKGHQPMETADGRYTIVFNGEIYNYREIRKELISKGVTFHSNGDTEVVLYALSVWGIAALKKFNGMFAIGFYDTLKNSLLLARDQFGIKPLYYFEHPEGIIFASQYNQILAHPWSQASNIDYQSLSLYFHLGYVPAPFGLVKDTHMLEPGTFLQLSPTQKTIKPFYTFPQYAENSRTLSVAQEELEHVISQAVKRQMVSDVPVASFLSGGIDSPLVTAHMQESTKDKITAYTIGSDNINYDESEDAKQYASQIGCQQILRQFSPDNAHQYISEVIESCGEPLADDSIFPTLMVSQFASENHKVILSGDGGDELFFGYFYRISSILSSAKDFRHPRIIRNLRWALKKYFNLGGGYWNLRWPDVGRWYREKHTQLSGEWQKAIFPDITNWPSDARYFNYNGWDQDETAQWLRWNETVCHLNRVLLKVDRASMYHSLEVRVPLLDMEIVKAALTLSWQNCLDIKNKLGKTPLRAALSKHTCYQSTGKQGFSIPMGQWLKTTLKPMFTDTLLCKKELLGLPINKKQIEKLYKAHVNGEADYSRALWNLLSLSLWESHHFKRSHTF